MTAAVLPGDWFELIHAATARTVSSEARRSSRSLRVARDLAPSISVDGSYQESLVALFQAYKDAARPNWDGYGAQAVSSTTLTHAIRFLSLIPSTAPSPEIMAHPDGDLAFEWSFGPRGILTVSIGKSGELSYAALIGQTRQHGAEFLHDAIPESITLVLRRLNSLQ